MFNNELECDLSVYLVCYVHLRAHNIKEDIMTTSTITIGNGTIYYSNNIDETPIALAQGVSRYKSNATVLSQQIFQITPTPQPRDDRLASGIEDFGNIVNAAGGIMSSITKNADEQYIYTFNVLNNTPYAITMYSLGGSDFNDAYLIESFDTLAPGDSGVIKFEVNTESTIYDVPFDMKFYICDGITKQHIETSLSFDDPGSYGFGLTNASVDWTNFSINNFESSSAAALSGFWFVGNAATEETPALPSFGVGVYSQKDESSDFSITFTPFA